MSEKWVYPGAPVIQQYLLVISFFTLQTQVYPIARSNALYIIKGINSYYIYFLLCTSECFMWRYLIQSNSCSINRFLKFFINSLVRYSKIAIYEYTNINNNHIHTLLLITVIKLNIYEVRSIYPWVTKPIWNKLAFWAIWVWVWPKCHLRN